MNVKKHQRRIVLLALGCLCCFAAAGAADQRQGAIGAGGEVYLTETGAYGDLFPGSSPPRGVSAGSQVLALGVTKPDAPAQRLLVPGIDASALEGAPALLYEDDSKTLYVLWAARLGSLSSALYLASFDGTSWSQPIKISGNPFSAKASPRLAVTRDSYLDATVTPAVAHHRTVLHAAWAENDASGLLEVYYLPVIFEDGAFLGFSATPQSLNSLENGAAPAAAVSPDLAAAFNMQSGRDGRIVVVSFASATSGRLDTVEIDVLPREVTLIADSVVDQIQSIGPRFYPAHLADLANHVATGVLAMGGAFQPEVLQALADKVHSAIMAGAGAPFQNLADNVRASLIDLGFRLTDRGLRGFEAQSASPLRQGSATSSLQLAGGSLALGQASPPSQWLQFRLDSSRALPDVGPASGGAGFSILSSPTGGNALIAWQPDAGHLVYTTSQGEGWSDPHRLQLTDKLTLDKALAYLQQHLR